MRRCPVLCLVLCGVVVCVSVGQQQRLELDGSPLYRCALSLSEATLLAEQRGLDLLGHLRSHNH